MKPKTIVGIVLVAFAAASVGVLVAKEVLNRGEPAAPAPTPAAGDGIIVYYFYSNVRCPTCRAFEAYTDEAVRDGFAEAMRDGRLHWRPVNIDEPGNGHFKRDYNLFAKSVVAAEIRGGQAVRWKNLERIWNLVGDKDAFLQYIRDEVRPFVEGQ
jgi:hypothetical protein